MPTPSGATTAVRLNVDRQLPTAFARQLTRACLEAHGHVGPELSALQSICIEGLHHLRRHILVLCRYSVAAASTRGVVRWNFRAIMSEVARVLSKPGNLSVGRDVFG